MSRITTEDWTIRVVTRGSKESTGRLESRVHFELQDQWVMDTGSFRASDSLTGGGRDFRWKLAALVL